MDPIIIGILICVGFMGFIISLIVVILRARKKRRELYEKFEEEPVFEQR